MDSTDSTLITLYSIVILLLIVGFALVVIAVVLYLFCHHRLPKRYNSVPTIIHHNHPVPVSHLSCVGIGCQGAKPAPILQMPPPESVLHPSFMV